MTEELWPTDWLRGVLALCVLHVLLDGPSYGYAITQRLESAGLGKVKGGTLYPLLGRLEEAGHVEVEWRPGDGGPGRKYFALTALGRDEAHRQARRWADFTDVIRDVVGAADHPRRPIVQPTSAPLSTAQFVEPATQGSDHA